MRKLLLLGLLFLIPHQAKATWSAPTQSVFNNSCTASTSCVVNIASTGVGHLLVCAAHIGNAQALNSCTASTETFTIGGSGCQGFNFSTETGCAYVLSSMGGSTSVTCNWNGTASATNTTCEVYEVAYTAQSITFDGHGNQNNAASSSPSGFNFSATLAGTIQGNNDIEFQILNVASGTPSAIDSSFTLDNHTGQVADAHLLNTILTTAPTWTNSGSAASVATGFAFTENFTTTPIVAPSSSALQIAYDFNGRNSTQELAVTAPGQFKLVFEYDTGWGLSQWYDLVNDPNATTNLFGPCFLSGGGQDPTLAKLCGLQRTYHGASSGNDSGQFALQEITLWPMSPRALNILEATPNRVVVQTTNLPSVLSSVYNNLPTTITYYIYPNGQIYFHLVSTATNAVTWTNTNNIFSVIALEDPTQTGTTPPDSQGWIRASTTQNPYSNAGLETYVFAYWSPSTPAPYTNYTKASILLVRSPNNLHDGGEVIHSWGSGTGHGVVRWGWLNTDTISVGSGGTEVEDGLIQLGTQGSSVLPNMTVTSGTCSVCSTIANAYIALPTPPSALSISSAVNEGTTAQFTTNQTSGGTWSCSGCVGAVNASTGLYTAPGSVTPQASHGGWQILPNNHVYNTNIASMPINANNATWMSTGSGTNRLRARSGSGTNVNYFPAFPFNYTTPSTNAELLIHSQYSTNDGVYQIPPFPTGLIESGWLSAKGNTNSDHHLMRIDTTTGIIQENYQYYCGNLATTAASVNGSNVATLTFAKDPRVCGINVGSTVCVGSFPTSTYFNICPQSAPVPATVTVATANSISFALTHGAATPTDNGLVTLNSPMSMATWSTCAGNGSCNSQSAQQYTQHDYPLPTPTTDAAGLMLTPLVLRLQEMENAVNTGGTIKHALRVTLGAGFEGSTNIWPGTAFASDDSGPPFGVRFRLNSGFDCSISGAGGITSTIGHILCLQLQQYGLLNSDGGNNWQVTISQEPWPQAYNAAFTEIANASKNFAVTNVAIAGCPGACVATVTANNDLTTNSTQVNVSGTSQCAGINGNNFFVTSASSTQFTYSLASGSNCSSVGDIGTVTSGLTNYLEAIDESSLMVSSTSGVTPNNREQVCYSVGNTCTDVALQGVAVGLTQNVLYIMAGTPTQNLNSYVNVTGDPNTTVTWSMSPTVGTLTASGSYTAPASQATATSTTVTATSGANANVSAQMTIWICPQTGCRFVQGGSDFTDSGSNVWKGGWGLGVDNLPQWTGQTDGTLNVTDKQLWNAKLGTSNTIGDYRVDVLAPQGSYQITYRLGTSTYATGKLRDIVTQGSTVASGTDMVTIAGGQHLPYSFQVVKTVGVDNKLSFYVYGDANITSTSGDISSISIIPGAVRPRSGGLP